MSVSFDEGRAGDNRGCLLAVPKKEEVEQVDKFSRGPGTTGLQFTRNLKLKVPQKRRRRITPIFNGYRPQFYFRTNGRK